MAVQRSEVWPTLSARSEAQPDLRAEHTPAIMHDAEGTWLWVDNSPLAAYSKWLKARFYQAPDNANGGQDCLGVWTYIVGRWSVTMACGTTGSAT